MTIMKMIFFLIWLWKKFFFSRWQIYLWQMKFWEIYFHFQASWIESQGSFTFEFPNFFFFFPWSILKIHLMRIKFLHLQLFVLIHYHHSILLPSLPIIFFFFFFNQKLHNFCELVISQFQARWRSFVSFISQNSFLCVYLDKKHIKLWYHRCNYFKNYRHSSRFFQMNELFFLI